MSKYLDEDFQKLLFAGTRGTSMYQHESSIYDSISPKRREEKYVLQTGVCRELNEKLVLIQLAFDPGKKYSKNLLQETNLKIENLDKRILREMKKHKFISSVITSPMDTDIVIESNHPVLKFARKWLGVNSPIDRDYSSFLQDVAEHPRKDVYVEKEISREDQIKAESAKKMYSDVQRKVAIEEQKAKSEAANAPVGGIDMNT